MELHPQTFYSLFAIANRPPELRRRSCHRMATKMSANGAATSAAAAATKHRFNTLAIPLLVASLLLSSSQLACIFHVYASNTEPIPHTHVSSVIAENMHATDQAFGNIHRLVDGLQQDYHEYRHATEQAILQAIRSCDSSSNDGYAGVSAQLRLLVEQFTERLAQRIRERHCDMDGMVLMAEELHDTNLQRARHIPHVKEALRHLLQLRDTKNGRLDTVLGELTRDCSAVTEAKLLALQGLTVASNSAAAAAMATATANADADPIDDDSFDDEDGADDDSPATSTAETIVLQLLDELRATVHLNKAQCHACMAEQEHEFRKASLLITIAERDACK